MEIFSDIFFFFFFHQANMAIFIMLRVSCNLWFNFNKKENKRGGKENNEGFKCTNVSITVVILCDREMWRIRELRDLKKNAQERVWLVGMTGITQTFGG